MTVVFGVVINDRMTAADHADRQTNCCRHVPVYCTCCERCGIMAPQKRRWRTFYEQLWWRKILYCAPALSGFCSAANRAKLDAFLRKCKRSGYCELSVPPMAELFTDADDTYFLRNLANKNHVLQTFLPERQAPAYSLRVKTHNKTLIDKPPIYTNTTF